MDYSQTLEGFVKNEVSGLDSSILKNIYIGRLVEFFINGILVDKDNDNPEFYAGYVSSISDYSLRISTTPHTNERHGIIAGHNQSRVFTEVETKRIEQFRIPDEAHFVVNEFDGPYYLISQKVKIGDLIELFPKDEPSDSDDDLDFYAGYVILESPILLSTTPITNKGHGYVLNKQQVQVFTKVETDKIKQYKIHR